MKISNFTIIDLNRSLTFYFFLILFVSTSTNIFGQLILGESLLGPGIAPGEKIVFSDPQCSNPLNCEGEFSICEYKTFVQLSVDHLSIGDVFNNYQDGTTYTVEVNYRIDGPQVSNPNEVYTIKAQFNNQGGQFKNKQVQFFDHQYYLQVEVTEVYLKIGQGISTLSIPKSTVLEVGAYANKYNSMSAMDSGNKVSYNTIDEDGYILMSFDAIEGATGYDLEWTWIDNELSDDAEGNNNVTGNEPYDFRFNSTRINIDEPITNYKIANIYRRGYLMARYRAIGNQDCDNIQFTEWNILGDEGFLDDPGIPNYLTINEGHQEELNWQHSRSYAEERKSKDVINYFDGSLRNRQTVSKLESEEHSIFAETIYDHVGRPAVQVLPSPAFEGKEYFAKIDFVSGLNISTSGSEYNWSNFELDVGCSLNVNPLKEVNGAGLYYSRDNGVGLATEQDLVPNSFGFPFTHTVYAQDGTGRLRFQGGVGSDHQIYTQDVDPKFNHGTRYYYGVPAQVELDRLFGSDAGYSRYYQKNMVVDPNGQVSVSYLDNKNRVIATALAGNAPLELDVLDSEREGIYRDVVDLSENSHPGTDDAGNKMYSLSHSFLVTSEDTDVSIYYQTAKADFTDPECIDDICFDCVYELDLSLTDDCGNNLHTHDNPKISTEGEQQHDDPLACSEGTKHVLVQSIESNLGIGNYTLNKILRLNGEKLKEYEDLYVENNTCIIPEVELFHSILADVSGCIDADCADVCINDPIEGVNVEDYIDGPLEDYIDAISECFEGCDKIQLESINKCDHLLEGMLADVSPFGQYGLIRDEGGEVVLNPTTIVCASIYYSNTILGFYQDPIVDFGNITVEYNDAMVNPKTLPLVDFVALYDDSWAMALIPLHPEYAIYEWCLGYEDESGYNEIYDFEAEFMAIDNFEEANSLGYLNPTSLGSPPTINNISITTLTPSPDQLDIEFQNFVFLFDDFGFTIWQYAYLIALSNTINVGAYFKDNIGDIEVNDFLNQLFNEFPICNQDRYWEAFKSLYIHRVRNPHLDMDLDAFLMLPSTNFNFDVYNIIGIDLPGPLCPELATLTKRFIRAVPPSEDMEIYETINEANDDLNPQIEDACASTCAAYRDDWAMALSGCLDLNPFDMEKILTAFEEICNEGCDVYHVLGSSTLPEGEGVSFEYEDQLLGPYSSFEEALDDILAMDGHTTNPECNALLISSPPPYDTDVFAGEMPFIDDCVCDKYNSIYSKYESNISGNQTANLNGFVEYLEDTYKEDFDILSITDIHCACALDHEYRLVTPINSTTIPDPFACKACISCEEGGINQMSNLIDEFKTTEYWIMFADIIADAMTDDVLLQNEEFRNVFTNWLNQRLNFNLTAIEYIDFMDYCGTPIIQLLARDSQFSELVKSGVERYQSLPVYKSDKNNKDQLLRSTSVNGDVTLDIAVNPTSAKIGNGVIVTVTLENTSSSTVNDIDFELNLPTGWTYDENQNPDPLNGGTTLEVESKYTITDFSLSDSELLTWEFTTIVPDNIYLSKNYNFNASIEIPTSGEDVEVVDGEALLWVEITDPCAGGIEKEEDMVDFLNQVFDLYDEATSCSSGILLSDIQGFDVSSINMWEYISIQNLKVYICNDQDLDGNGINEFIFTFVNTCDLGLLCDFTLYNLESLEYVDKFTGIEDVLDISFDGGHLLEVDYRDNRYDDIITLPATSSCFSFKPCDTRLLCNRSIHVPVGYDEDECWTSLLNLAILETKEEYETIIDESRDRFQELYVSQCMNKETINEYISLTYENKEYHYTLYYYDQSGLLYKTIPPQGVELIKDESILDKVAAHRDDPSSLDPTYPSHLMLTKYEYNSFGNVDHQNSPDAEIMNYWYDYLGRPVLSQDGRQKGMGNVYSYSFYDGQGRIVEIGEVTCTKPITDVIGNQDLYEINANTIHNWLFGAGGTLISRSNVIRTIYDANYEYAYTDVNLSLIAVSIDDHFETGFERKYLRKRISSSLYYELILGDVDLSSIPYDYGTHYDYDVHGNVKTLIQEYRELVGIKQDLKRIDYSYDLISGNTYMVSYQEGKDDQFYHKYEYDADNRLVSVKTSHDKFIWDEDATYSYYDHGPLARTEMGEYSVQGLDYVYTIHGWIKAVNGNSLDSRLDPGQDGSVLSSLVANDAFSYSLDYYGNDYEWIRNENDIQIQATGAPSVDELYNGNISRMTTSLRGLNNNILQITPTQYRYDQLHRIKRASQYNALNLNTFTYNGTETTYNYYSDYTYDANGNTLSLNRNNALGQSYDRLGYNYFDMDGNNQPERNNLLEYIRDEAGSTPDGDLESQSSKNYRYDGTGNMISDASEKIKQINWDQYGKIREILRENPPTFQQPNLEYHYDAMGNRIVKVVKNGTSQQDWVYTYYVRDASGNVMATYEGYYDPSKEIINKLYEREHHIYGSSRLGIKKSDKPEFNLAAAQIPNEDLLTRTSGNRNYELSNHLGNVLSVVSDNKLLAYQGFSLPSYRPEILSFSDYYPFGWAKPGRTESTTDYRYAFNGKEKDDGVKGSGVQYDYGFRIYDSRVARFLSVDPLMKSYPGHSPYTFVANSPILFIDEDGRDLIINPATGKAFKYTPGMKLTSKDAFAIKIVESLNKIYSTGEGQNVINSLVSSEIDHNIVASSNTSNQNFNLGVQGNRDNMYRKEISKENYSGAQRVLTETDKTKINIFSGNMEVNWDKRSSDATDNVKMNTTIVLAHELFHAFQFNEGRDNGTFLGLMTTQDESGVPLVEVQAVGFENYIRGTLYDGTDFGQSRGSYSNKNIDEYLNDYSWWESRLKNRKKSTEFSSGLLLDFWKCTVTERGYEEGQQLLKESTKDDKP